MRGAGDVLYWVVAGALVGIGLIGLTTVGLPVLIAGLAMAAVGFWRPGVRGAWAFPIGFGGLPALVFLLHIVGGIRSALSPYCAQPADPGAAIAPGTDPVSCSSVPVSYYAMFGVFAAVALVGVALRRLSRRPRAT